MKIANPPKTEDRKFLTGRRTVVELRSFEPAVDDGDCWEQEVAPVLGRSADGVDQCLYFHLGDVVYSPWGCTCKPLKLIRKESHVDGDLYFMEATRSHS